jgi:hypothetical protein
VLYYGGSRTRGTRRIRGFEGERSEEGEERRGEERRGEERRGETHFELHMSGMIQIVISIFDILSSAISYPFYDL